MSSTDEKLKRTVLHELFELAPSKAQRTQLRIVEAAIENYAALGFEKTGFEAVAKSAGVTRRLVQHYFADREALFTLAVKVVRAEFQRLAVSKIEKATAPREKLRAYVESTFEWIRKSRKRAKVWLIFFHYCSIDDKFRKMNTELVSMGHERITALLEAGKNIGEFTCVDARSSAKLIQVVITGALASALTETLPTHFEEFRSQVVDHCLRIADPQ